MLNPALKASGRWAPRRLGPALALWIDPSDIATMFQSNAGTTPVTDTSVCGYAGDKSGNAFHLTSAADDTTRPTWNNNGGLPYLLFDSTNDILFRSAALNLYNSVSGFSVFAAVRTVTGGLVSRILVAEGSSSSNNPLIGPLKTNAATGTTFSEFYRNDANANISLDALAIVNGFSGGVDDVVGATDDGVSALTGYVNSTATGISYTRSGTVTVDRFALGGLQRAAASSWFSARVYGLVVVKRVLTSGERANLITYLGAKMGLSI